MRAPAPKLRAAPSRVCGVGDGGVHPVIVHVLKQEPWPCGSGLWPQDPGLSAADMSSTWIPHRQADFKRQHPGRSFSARSRLLCRRVLRCSCGISLVSSCSAEPSTFLMPKTDLTHHLLSQVKTHFQFPYHQKQLNPIHTFCVSLSLCYCFSPFGLCLREFLS